VPSAIANTSNTNVPPAVTTAFTTRFPGAHLRRWQQRPEGFIADFRIGRRKLFAYYSTDGTWKGTEAPVKWTKLLPPAVREAWERSDYKAWQVVDIKKIDRPEGPLYTLHVSNGDLLDSDHHDALLEEYVLFYSASGELTRKDKMP
jgi:hypothetical protein